jgi:16S rRNA (cytosine1402-N4)-methyltransferase
VPVSHTPVLLEEVVAWLGPAGPGLLVDATLGLGGHAAALLFAQPGFTLLGLDRDPEALALAAEALEPFSGRVRLVAATFDRLPAVLAELEAPAPVAVLADLGCSSLQLDRPERGFSFQQDGPLDMRMDADGPSAADLVNHAEPGALMRILWDWGEERHARAIVRAIVARRLRAPITSTGELSGLVVSVVGHRTGRIHPATRTFQALRIAVNDELGQLERFLEPAVRSLRPGGRLAVISFHSLEDRITKHTLRRLEGRCTCPPDLPRCVCGARATVRVLTPKAIRPEPDEVESNPRARSARLRVAARLREEAG